MRAEPMTAGAMRVQRPAHEVPGRRGELGLALQEAFTVGVRLRTRRQVAANADLFRTHIKQLLTNADSQARSAGYDPELVRVALYAFIAFLDESVLNSQQSMFADWPRQPLQEEVFGDHVAGENFFRNLAQLMSRQDSEDVADVLEVYQLALLLGFRGKYATNPGALQATLTGVQDKIRRVRGRPPLSPSWALPDRETLPRTRDPWLPRLTAAGGVAFIVAFACWLIFRLALGSGASDVNALVTQLAR